MVILVADYKTNFVQASTLFLCLFGYTSGKVLFKTFWKIISRAVMMQHPQHHITKLIKLVFKIYLDFSHFSFGSLLVLLIVA